MPAVFARAPRSDDPGPPCYLSTVKAFIQIAAGQQTWACEHQTVTVVGDSSRNRGRPFKASGWQFTSADGTRRFQEGNREALAIRLTTTAQNYGGSFVGFAR